MPIDPQSLLPAVIDAARIAGDMVAREFCLPDGPRFSDHITAPVDHEIEMFLRDRLIGLLPARFVGEEAGVVARDGNRFCWVVDPHDGTRAFLEGKRGSAVSIALMHDGALILGVVYAPLSPDRGPDMISWAQGGGIVRNGAPVDIDLRTRALSSQDVVFLNHGAWQRPAWNGAACAPARFMPLPSIAYRLARVAVGDGIATQTLRPVNALDIAAGHALLLAAGGVLVTEDNTPVTYTTLGESRPSACFGGAPQAVDVLRTRTWRGSTETRRQERVTLTWPRSANDDRLSRAVGCLLGVVVADIAGSAATISLARGLIAQPIAAPMPAASTFGALAVLAIAGIAPAESSAVSFDERRAVFAAIAAALNGGDRTAMRDAALSAVPVGSTLCNALMKIPSDAASAHIGVVENAFRLLASGCTAEQAILQTRASRGDATLIGALVGAADGRIGLPTVWSLHALTNRAPDQSDTGWADDLVDLTEALLRNRDPRE